MQHLLKHLSWIALTMVTGGYFGLHLIVPWFDLPAIGAPTDADTIVILGGELEGRVAQGAALFNAGAAPEVWITGDSNTEQRVTYAESMAHAAFLAGVPIRRQILLPSTSTFEDGRIIAAMVRERGVRRLILVTSWYHGRRAVCTINHQLAGSGVTLIYHPAPSALAPRETWWRHMRGMRTIMRETLATAYYTLRYGLSPSGCSSLSASE